MTILRFSLLALVESMIDIDFKCQENGLIIKLNSEDTKNLQHIVKKSYVDDFMQSRFNDACQFNGEIQKFFKFSDCSKEIEDEYHSQGNLKKIANFRNSIFNSHALDWSCPAIRDF